MTVKEGQIWPDLPGHQSTVFLYMRPSPSRSSLSGATFQLPESDEVQYSTTYERLYSHLCVCMGGRVAEELIYGREKVCLQSSAGLLFQLQKKIMCGV